jgi:hypothetical protein
MKSLRIIQLAAFIAAIGIFSAQGLDLAQVLRGGEYIAPIVWPEPPVITPGEAGGPPSDAMVLFDGKDMSKWKDADAWKVKDGAVTSGGHSIDTKDSFGDCQLHVEWATPTKVKGRGQGRGNSGVFMMTLYEVQVLDSYNNDTYYDGQAGAIYKQHPPMVNASRKPGEWQTYDIMWETPKFDKEGKLLKPAYVTVLHNGVIIQNHFEVKGPTSWTEPPHYTAHAAKMPIQLQFHGDPVRFRNIWIREMKDIVGKPGEHPHHPG